MELGFALLALGLLLGGSYKQEYSNWSYFWFFLKISIFLFFAGWVFPIIWVKVILYIIFAGAFFLTLVTFFGAILPDKKKD